MFDSILLAERTQRQNLQRELEQARNLLHLAVRTLDPEIIEEHRQQNPQFLEELDLNGWAQLLRDAKRREVDRLWGGENQVHLQARLQRLQTENAHTLQRLGVAQRRVTALTAYVQELEARHETWRQANAAAPLHLPGEIVVPPLPSSPPTAFREILLEDTWERDCLFLALLALSGWSQQQAVLGEMASRVDISPQSGTFVRQLKRMHAAGLIFRESIPVMFGRINILGLTDRGRRLADALSIVPVEAEWERLQRLRGTGQDAHHAMICLFCQAARQRRYRTQVCPQLDAADASPDALVVGEHGERSYVLVEMRETPADVRLEQWQTMAQHQGFVALCASTADSRQALIQVAGNAGLAGRITDFESLRKDLTNTLWAEQWPALQPETQIDSN